MIIMCNFARTNTCKLSVRYQGPVVAYRTTYFMAFQLLQVFPAIKDLFLHTQLTNENKFESRYNLL